MFSFTKTKIINSTQNGIVIKFKHLSVKEAKMSVGGNNLQLYGYTIVIQSFFDHGLKEREKYQMKMNLISII